MSALDWMVAVPLWAWLVLAVVYALAALGWWLAMNESEPGSGRVWIWSVVWPLASLIAAVLMTATGVMRLHRQAQARQRGWRE